MCFVADHLLNVEAEHDRVLQERAVADALRQVAEDNGRAPGDVEPLQNNNVRRRRGVAPSC